MKWILVPLAFSLVALSLQSCLQEPAQIVLGRDWNSSKKVVYDTASSFHVNDPILLQMYNGDVFGVDSVKMTVYRGSSTSLSDTVYTRVVPVKPSESSLILKGHGSTPLTARGLVGASAAGSYTIEFSVQGTPQTRKQIELTRSLEK